MNSPLPPDPYKILGVAKDAKLPEIRSAHRKLVLKCHPDKIQDAALKAVKQDEFQKVQQAYEILSDDTKRSQYDDQVKLFELRKEMGRGNPTPRSNPFEYEVKTAEPRANSYARTAPKVYTYPTAVPRSHEDLYEEPIRHTPKKSSSYESATDRDRKRPTTREDDRAAREAMLRKLAEEERIREEKIREKEKRDRSHREKKKSVDKERKVRGEEKTRSRQPFFEDESSDEDYRERLRAAEKKEKRRMEEERREQAAMHAAAEAVRAQARADAQRAQIKEAPMDPKWSDHRDFAGAYMQAARRKVVAEPEDDRHHPRAPAPGLRRAETSFNPPSQYQVRYAQPAQQYSDDDSPRRSSGYKDPRRSSDTPPTKREKSRRRSPEHPRDPYINIVETASPQLPPKKPTLKTYTSEPPMSQSRKEPSRARTQDDYPRKEAAPPPLPRAQTFTGDSRDRGRNRAGTRLREYASAESDEETPMYSPRLSQSPRRAAAEPTVYRVQDSRAHPIPSRSHRSDLHGLNDPSYTRERSVSPRGTPAHRPGIARNPPSGEYRTSPSAYYSVPEAPPTKPIVVTARPKLPREGSRSHSHRTAPNAAYDPSQVRYAPAYDTSQVKFAEYPAAGLYDSARKGSEHRDYYTPRGRAEPIYT